MEENVKRLVSELSENILKIKPKYPEVETARKALLTYVQDPNADITGTEKKVKQLEDTLSQRNAKKTPVIETIEKIREALRVKRNGRNDGTDSREDKGRPRGSPALPGTVTPMKNQEAENQLSRQGSPALTGKGAPVKGQGGEQQHSREIRRLEAENKYLKKIMDDLHKNLIDGKTKQHKEEKLPEDIKNDQSIIELQSTAKKVTNKFYELETLAEYATSLLEELSNFLQTRNESNSNILSEPPKVTSQNVDKKHLKKMETLRETSEQTVFNEKIKRSYKNACHIHSQMKENENLRISLEARIGHLEVSNKRLNDIQDQNTDLKKEAESLRLRLSELSGAKLSLENPNIADLSDPNRPTKLGEKYSEIYTNQWTDAFLALSKQTPEQTEDERILFLYNILIDGYHFCKGVRQTQILSLQETMLDPTGLRGMETIGNRQKKEVGEIFDKNLSDAAKLSSNLSSESMVRVAAFVWENMDEFFGWIYTAGPWECRIFFRQNEFIFCHTNTGPSNCMTCLASITSLIPKHCIKKVNAECGKAAGMAFLTNEEKKSKYGEDMKLCEAYIKECIRICWHMQVQTPPLCLDLKNLKGQPFVKDTYKEYTTSGKNIAFIVWPALFLHKKGPLIAKGVAQGI